MHVSTQFVNRACAWPGLFVPPPHPPGFRRSTDIIFLITQFSFEHNSSFFEEEIMAPFLATLLSREPRFDPTVSSNEFRTQWVHPSDVFSVLLILGGDIVARALAQLAGSGLTPVTFSFGMASLSPILTKIPC